MRVANETSGELSTVVSQLEEKRFEQAFGLSWIWTRKELNPAHIRLANRFRSEDDVLIAINQGRDSLLHESIVDRAIRVAGLGEHGAAMHWFDQAPPDAGGFWFYHWKGRSQLGIDRFDDAALSFREAQRLKPDSSSSHWIGFALSRAGKLEESLGWFQTALRLSDTTTNQYWVGLTLAKLARWEEAIIYLEPQPEDSRDREESHYFGRALLETGRREDAVKHLEKAAKGSTDGDHHYWLGEALVKLGRLSPALACFKEAVRLKPSAANCRRLGSVLVAVGEFALATVQFRKALKVGGEAVNLRRDLIEALRKDERFAEALKESEKLTASDLRIDDYRTRAQLFSELGRRKEALAGFEKCVQIRATAEDYVGCGIQLEALGQPDRALLAFRDAVKRDANSPEGNYRLARRLMEVGNASEAARHAAHAYALRHGVNDFVVLKDAIEKELDDITAQLSAKESSSELASRLVEMERCASGIPGLNVVSTRIRTLKLTPTLWIPLLALRMRKLIG